MPVSDTQLIDAWKQVLTLSRLEPGQTVLRRCRAR